MNNAKRFLRRVLPVTGGLLLLCAGCDPTDWICWAPDGEHAFVQGADNDTFLIDRAGKIVGKATDARAWFPDSRRVVAVHTVKPASWDEYAKLLGPDRAGQTITASAGLVNTLENYHGEWSKFSDSAEYKKWESNAVGRAFAGDWITRSVVLYLQQTNPKILAPALNSSSLSISNLIPDIHELRTRDVLSHKAGSEQLLARFPDEVLATFPSPNGNVLAFTLGEPDGPSLYLLATSTNGLAVKVDDGVLEAAWSTDSRNLVYPKIAAPYGSQNTQLGTITSRQVCGTNGEILAKFEDAKDLAGLVLDPNHTRAACLADGRILFDAAPIHLPALSSDEPNPLTLFAIRPGPKPTLESVVRPSDSARLPDRVDRFALSPDGKRVAIVDHQGNVSVLSLDTGELVAIQPSAVYSNSDKYTQLIPSWRTTNEVTCLVPIGDPSGSTQRVEVVLANLNGQKTAISLSWSNAMMKGLLLPSE
ncbi:MAG TPA: hypothetical protein VMV72_03600 [Verrucomicrobiae bacterium]|nr:hypothetical protein [Verrucomicrobiae bacterium]